MGEELITLGISPEKLARIIKNMSRGEQAKFADGQIIEKYKPERSYSIKDPIDSVRLYCEGERTNLVPLVQAACQILNAGYDPAVVRVSKFRTDIYYREG